MKNNQSGMTLIVKTITRLTVGLILIYAVYLALQGHSGPGGGFAGGIIIALSFINLMLAYGKEAVIKKLDETRGLRLASLAGIAFLYFAAIGFTRWRGAGFIPLYDITLALLVVAGVFVIFLALVALTGDQER